MRWTLVIGSILYSGLSSAQMVVWAEEFENSCVQNCLATSYSGINGAWSTINTGTNGICANRWFISCQENGNAIGTCGTGCGNNETLHIGNDGTTCSSPNGCFFCPTGDCGAAYDASCPSGICFVCCSCQSSQTSVRAVSPTINLSGLSTLSLRFKYMEGGAGVNDNGLLDYFDGAVWTQLADLPKTPAGACGGQGMWTSYSIALPASANNNPNVRIGFRWVNNDDGSGADPSIAVDDVEISIPYVPLGQGLVVNELSNGASGNKEYIELAVIGPTCTIDIRGIIVDDNNGVVNNGFGTTMTGSGVSTGHLRFSNAAQWAAVPAGSLILIYNNTDVNPLVPAIDLSDTAPQDSVYVIPSNDPLVQGCGTYPNGVVTATYPTCTYGAGNWNYVAFRDQGDAGQTRNAAGRYFHGISYGPAAQNMNTGSIDLLRITTLDGAGRVFWFNSGNYRQVANFSTGLIAGNETPGHPNNAANYTWLLSYRCLVLPMELIEFTAEPMDDRIRVRWATATERDVDHFTLERSTDGNIFEPIASLAGAGNSVDRRDYVHDDLNAPPGVLYYRLWEHDLDGAEHLGAVIAVFRKPSFSGSISVNEQGVTLSPAEAPYAWELNDPAGRTIHAGTVAGAPVAVPIPEGLFLLTLGNGHGRSTVWVHGVGNTTLIERLR